MSGTPRADAGIAVLPAGSGPAWELGRENTWLNPPPEKVQAASAACAALYSALPHFAPMPGLMYVVRGSSVAAVGLVQRYVPPTPVTSGSEAGHSTVGYGIRLPPCPTGDLLAFAVPPS